MRSKKFFLNSILILTLNFFSRFCTRSYHIYFYDFNASHSTTLKEIHYVFQEICDKNIVCYCALYMLKLRFVMICVYINCIAHTNNIPKSRSLLNGLCRIVGKW